MKYLYVDNLAYPYPLKSVYAEKGQWPEGKGVDIDEDIFREYFHDTPPDGKRRVAGDDGMPAWADVPPPIHEELIRIAESEQNRLLKQADAVMLDWRTELMLGEISESNKAKLSEWLAYKNEVKSIDVTTNPEHIDWPVPPEAQKVQVLRATIDVETPDIFSKRVTFNTIKGPVGPFLMP